MRKVLTTLFLSLLVATRAAATGEQDFAARFLSLYNAAGSLTCKTISPQMMERILSLKAVESNKQALQVISQLKSIRIIGGGENAAEARDLFQKANALAQRNKRRYTLYARSENASIYTRRHGEQLVELVAIRLAEGQTFSLLNLTGNMSDDFIKQILEI